MGTSRPLMSLFVAIVATPAFLVVPTTLFADVKPGFDLFATDPQTTFALIQIPPNFFDPGSNPVFQNENFRGVPFGAGSSTDTIVHRLDKVDLDKPFPSNGTTQIQITGLSLEGVQPIIVTYLNRPPEQWIIQHVGLSANQQVGSMTITQNDKDGGTFNSVLPVNPVFTFVRPSDGATRTLDTGGMQPLLFRPLTPVPWCVKPPDNVDAHHGFSPSCDPTTMMPVLTEEEAMLAAHGIFPAIIIRP